MRHQSSAGQGFRGGRLQRRLSRGRSLTPGPPTVPGTLVYLSLLMGKPGGSSTGSAMSVGEAQRREGCVRSGRLRFLKNIENFQFITNHGEGI